MLKSIQLSATVVFVLMLASSCSSSRDTSIPAKTLLGHWRTDKGKGEEIHRCYSADGGVVFHNKNQDSFDREAYEIVEESPKARTIRVQWVGKGIVEKIKFSADGRTAELTLEPLSEPYNTLVYVDDNIESCR